ncbi:MAG: threonine synthase [Myxococcales bacterium]|nr:threonine synthase [Myxococcales bacterium]
MEKIAALRCVECGKAFREDEAMYTCPSCGTRPDGGWGILDVEYDYERQARLFHKDHLQRAERNIWRYLPILPLADNAKLPSLQIGWTPIMEFPELARRWGIANLYLKDDGRLPTGSFKDRASAVGTAKAVELGFDTICCASTGNAASSLAGFSANLGLRSYIFVPAHAPEGKVAQLRIFKSNVLLVEGTYDEAYYLCQEAAEAFGWYNRNCAINPYLIEGKKTAGLEAAEQMAGKIPDWVSVAVGDGCTIAGIWKGFVEMKRFGIIDKLPRLLGVQAEGAQPIFEAFHAGDETVRPRRPETLADSIAVGQPRNQTKALRAIRESGGAMVAVSDEEILSAMYELAQKTGVFGEPAGVTGIAGLLRAITDETVKSTETVLHIVSGNGLKDVRSAQRACPDARRINVSLDDVRAIVAADGPRPA